MAKKTKIESTSPEPKGWADMAELIKQREKAKRKSPLMSKLDEIFDSVKKGDSHHGS